jgi:TPR repeat protein
VKARNLILCCVVFFIFIAMPWFSSHLRSEEKVQVPPSCVDEALCAEMLRYGKQAYLRGKYLDAKEYFRKAVQADPTSSVAWRHYDLAAVFSLAEKVEQNMALIEPGVSTRHEAAGEGPAPPSPTKAEKKEKKEEKEEEHEFVIIEDEGC